MAERMTSPEEAVTMKIAMDAMIDHLEKAEGLDRGAVGAAMIGFGLGVMSANRGNDEALRAIDGARNALLSGKHS